MSLRRWLVVCLAKLKYEFRSSYVNSPQWTTLAMTRHRRITLKSILRLDIFSCLIQAQWMSSVRIAVFKLSGQEMYCSSRHRALIHLSLRAANVMKKASLCGQSNHSDVEHHHSLLRKASRLRSRCQRERYGHANEIILMPWNGVCPVGGVKN